MFEFNRRFPQVEPGTIKRSRTRLTTALHNGDIDLHIATGETTALDGKPMPLWSERILVALPNDHPLAASDVAYWTDQQFVLFSQHDPGRELENLLNSKLVAQSDRPRTQRHDVSRGVVKSLSRMGSALASC